MVCLKSLIIVVTIVTTLTLTSKAQYVLPITKHQLTKQFYTTFNVGVPVKTPVNLLLDLGTDLTWLNCHNLKSLASLNLINCQSPTCKSIPGTSCLGGNTCVYRKPNPSPTYRVVQDTVTFSTTKVRKSHFRPFTFSCAAAKTSTGVSGVLGLSPREHTFWRQVTSAFNVIPQFALCLPSSGSGHLYVGAVPDIATTTFTPMRVNSGDYIISAQSIYVDGTPLSLNPSLLNGGAKISMVVPYTVLHSDIYNALAQSITLKAKAMGISQVPSVAPFKNCFKAAGKKFPVIEFGLPGRMGEVKWTYHRTNTVFNVVNKAVVCLAFLDGGKQPKENIVVGTYQLQNYLIKFDMSRTVFSFSDSLLLHNTSCSS